MAQPTATDVHVDAVLTNISVAYIQQQSAFVATEVFPVVPVAKQTDKYFTYTKADWFRDEAQLRPPATESAGSGYGVSTATYSCDVYAIHKDVDNQVAKNSDSPLDPYGDAARFVAQRLYLRQEKKWQADAFAASIWGTDVTPTNLWSNYATSDPISDVETGKRTILSNTGFLPNTFVMGYQVWEKLMHHPDLVDRIKYSGGRTVTTEVVAQLFGLERVIVCMAVENTAAEGETASYSFVHGKHALLCYVNRTPGLLAPSAGYTFVWRDISQGLGTDLAIRRIDMPWLDAIRVEGQVAFDNKIVATDLGYFFNGAVS